jgi:hypothetical protein
MEVDKVVKSCDGTIILYLESSVYRIRVTQTINYKKFKKVGTEYQNVFLDEIIQNVQITSKNEDNIYYGTVSLPSRIMSKNITLKQEFKKYYLRLLNYDTPQKGNICLSTFKTYKCTRQLRSYWYKLLTEVDHLFFKNTDIYLIVPEQPFSQTIIVSNIRISIEYITNREEARRELLYDIGFQYYYKSIYISDLFKEDFDTKILEDAIKHIKDFYLDKFLYQVKSDFELYITLNQIKEDSDQLVFDFMLIEPVLGNKYVSFTNILLKPRINDLINRIKRKNFYLYTYAQHTISKDCLKDCYDKYYVPKSKIITRIPLKDSYDTLFKMEKQTIKIINAYNHPNKYHTYCAKFFLIQIGDKYFEISIKVTTYKYLERDQEFFNRFQESLISNFKDKEYFDGILPAYIEIYVKSVDPNIYEIPVSMYYTDTAKMYRETLLPIIVKTPIDLKLLLVQLWFRTLINLTPQSGNPVDTQKSYLFKLHYRKSLIEKNFQLFTNKLLKNPDIAYFLLMDVKNTTNFVKILKYTKNIGKVLEYIYTLKSLKGREIHTRKKEIQAKIDDLGHSKFKIVSFTNLFTQFIKYVNHLLPYTIWYVSEKIYITNYRNLLDFLDRHKVGDRDVAEIEITDTFTNFYTIYREGDFCHSIRQLTIDLKDEIRKFEISSSYHIGFHYPGSFKYQILHLNVYNSTTDSYVDVIRNQYNIHASRYISRYNIFNTDYTDADILVSRQLILNFKDFVDIYSKKINIKTIKEKLNDKYSPECYLPNIREILINSGINLVD